MRIPFVDRFRRMAANASGLVSTRLALFGLELQEELERQIGRLALLLAVFTFGALGLLFASVFALIIAWQHGHVLAAAGCLTAICLGVALACFLGLRHQTRVAPPPFAETLAEFKRDEASLRGDAPADAQASKQSPEKSLS